MTAYGALARWYDSLTEDVPYGEFADFYEKLLCGKGRDGSALLDLCCGTGTLTCAFAARGYEMIGVDASAEMLSEAEKKADNTRCAAKPLFLCQEASEIDLYGTVNGAYCCLDGMNYIPPDELPALLHRLHLFVEPGGRFAFDMHLPAHLKELDGQTFVDETEDVLCLWRAEFDETESALVYGMDIFQREGALWQRDFEEHTEYAHPPEALKSLLEKAGFENIRIISDCPLGEMGRIFIVCENTRH